MRIGEEAMEMLTTHKTSAPTGSLGEPTISYAGKDPRSKHRHKPCRPGHEGMRREDTFHLKDSENE